MRKIHQSDSDSSGIVEVGRVAGAVKEVHLDFHAEVQQTLDLGMEASSPDLDLRESLVES